MRTSCRRDLPSTHELHRTVAQYDASHCGYGREAIKYGQSLGAFHHNRVEHSQHFHRTQP